MIWGCRGLTLLMFLEEEGEEEDIETYCVHLGKVIEKKPNLFYRWKLLYNKIYNVSININHNIFFYGPFLNFRSNCNCPSWYLVLRIYWSPFTTCCICIWSIFPIIYWYFFFIFLFVDWDWWTCCCATTKTPRTSLYTLIAYQFASVSNPSYSSASLFKAILREGESSKGTNIFQGIFLQKNKIPWEGREKWKAITKRSLSSSKKKKK